MKKLQNLNDPLFKTLEADQMKKVQGGIASVGTWTEEEVKITGGGGCGCNDSSASDPEAAAGDDGSDG